MKRMIFPVSVLLVFLLLLSGCTDKRQETCLRLAEEHLQLLENAAEGDTLTLDTEASKRTDGFLSFRAHSQAFGADFQIRVASDDTVTDDYYTLTILSEAETIYQPVVQFALSGREPSCTVSVKSIFTPSLSGRIFSLSTALGAFDGTMLVCLEVSVQNGEMLSEEEIGNVLRTLRDSACPCEVNFPDDPRTFIVDGDVIFYLTADADGGSYVKRHEYTFGG